MPPDYQVGVANIYGPCSNPRLWGIYIYSMESSFSLSCQEQVFIYIYIKEWGALGLNSSLSTWEEEKKGKCSAYQ